jgi:hypothetical protein
MDRPATMRHRPNDGGENREVRLPAATHEGTTTREAAAPAPAWCRTLAVRSLTPIRSTAS